MCHVFIFTVFIFAGSGIGTGPGVIQDRFSPTLGRHRTNPLFNGHSGHMASQPQSQFDLGMKPFIKSNQVSINVFAALTAILKKKHYYEITKPLYIPRDRISIFTTKTRTIQTSSKLNLRTCIRASKRGSSMQTR